MSLGACMLCRGPLAVANGIVRCERCGNHQPMPSADEQASLLAPTDKPALVQAHDLPRSIEQRLAAVERRLAVLEQTP